MSSTSIDLLNNWHTVSAVTYAKMNEAIAASGTTPTDFTYTGSQGTITGKFGAWRLATGGSAKKCHMSLEITEGTFTILFAGVSVPYAIPDGCVALIEIEFGFSDQEEGSSKKDLGSIEEVSVEEISPTFDNDDIANSLFKDYLGAYLTENKILFQHVFATVDFSPAYENKGLDWLTPVKTSYAVAEYDEGATLENSVFGILHLIEGSEDTPTTSQVNRNVIPDGRDAGFLISAPKFLEHMVLGAVPFMFKDLKDKDPNDYFTIVSADSSVTNKSTLEMLPVELDNGTEVTPSVDPGDFKIEILNTTMKITGTNMEFEVDDGITAHLNYSVTTGITLDTENMQIDLDDDTMNEDGGGYITISDERIGLEKALLWTGLALNIVGTLGGVVAGTGKWVAKSSTNVTMSSARSTGAGSIKNQILGSIARKMFTGTPDHISKVACRWALFASLTTAVGLGFDTGYAVLKHLDAQANSDYSGVPQIDELTDSAFDKYVTFPDPINSFTLKSVALNNSLQFGLDVIDSTTANSS